MDKNDVIIRLENKSDEFIVENLIRDSFWNVYRPGAYEHFVMHLLRDDKDFIKELNFVMEKDGKIIGQNVFVKANLKIDNGDILPISTMGPICISNEYKRKGFGKILLDYSLKRAKEYGIKAIFFEGNYDFYNKSGFTYAREFNIRYHGLPSGSDDSFFLGIELEKDYLKGKAGEYQTPNIYMVDEKDVDDYDKKFPYKEKLKLDTQIF